MKEGKRVAKKTVVDHYYQLSPQGTKQFHELVNKVNTWQEVPLTNNLLAKARPYYSPDLPKDHPDHLLMAYGRVDNLEDIARTFIELQKKGELPEHRYINNIRYFIDELEEGKSLPNLIMVRGRLSRLPYLIDGTTRSIAMEVANLTGIDFIARQRVYIGRRGWLSPLLNWEI
ncbi:hypothetical protein M1116_03515 [Patescibacteria group bacterium]|nr:hypothetical protein [Patescibacteria group bacterium]